MNDYGKPQNDTAQQNEQAHELIDQLNLLEDVDRRITPEHIARRFRELLAETGDGDPTAPAADESLQRVFNLADRDDQLTGLQEMYEAGRCGEPTGLIGSMEAAAIAAARGAAADIITAAQLKARASADELQRALQEIADARRQAREAIEAERQAAEEIITATRDDALNRSAEMIQAAEGRAEEMLDQARRTAERVTAEMIQAAEGRAEEMLGQARRSAERVTAEMISDAKDQAAQILDEARSAAGQISTADTYSDAEEGDLAGFFKEVHGRATMPLPLATCNIAMPLLESRTETARDLSRLDLTATRGRAARGRRVFISHTSELIHALEEFVDTANLPAAGPRMLGRQHGFPMPDEIPPEYVPRDTDADEHGVRVKVAAAAQRGGFVLLTGGSSVGKTAALLRMLKGMQVSRSPYEERVKLARALARPADLSLADRHWAAGATWADLQAELILILAREDGRVHLVSAHKAATELASHDQPKASQVALLPPLPPEITGISIAARYRSATPEASVGGDLYEIIPTGHGIRVIIGDVRGKGLDAVLLARHVLSAFRRSAVAVPALERVAGEVGRAIRPHLGEEDFVTAVLAQIAPGGEFAVVNCGHHPPLLHHGGGLRPLTGTTAALPLGLEDDFTAFTASWLPGDRLLLYTDGLVESRNQHGDFLPEDQITTALLVADCDQALDTLMTAVRRHTGGHGHDDMALLLLEYGAYPHSSADGHPRPGRCQDS